MPHLTKRQKEIYDYIRTYIEGEGYAPSLEEIGAEFGLSSVATVHKHVHNLTEKGLLKKAWNRSRSIELVDDEPVGARVEIPLMGTVAAGYPIEAVETPDRIAVPPDMIGSRACFALRVQGDSMIDDHIMDGDVVLIEQRKEPRNGETVVALIRNEDATLKRFSLDGPTVTLTPANPRLSPMQFPAQDVAVQGVVIGLLRNY